MLPTGRDRAVWARDLLANRVLAGLGREPIRPTDAQLDAARARYTACVAAVREAGYRVHGDLEDLAPSEASGRAPGDVEDAEVLQAAVRALAGLLRLEMDPTDARGRQLVEAAARASTPTTIDRHLQRAAASVLKPLRAGDKDAVRKLASAMLPFGRIDD